MKRFFIGIDISKEKLDVCLTSGSNVLGEKHISNRIDLIETYFLEQQKCFGIEKGGLLVCAEYTGQYIYPPTCVCQNLGIDLWLENPAQKKYRSGVQRGKNDKLDARRIAFYAERFGDEAKLFQLPERTIGRLKQLLSERDMYLEDKKKYQSQLSDQKRFMAPADYQRKSVRLEAQIGHLEEVIGEIEQEIHAVIEGDETLAGQYALLCSVDGVGEKVAVKMIVETNAFRDFTDPRKFCCHAGVAPFAYTSGSSIHSRNRVSNRADKSIKALLHLSALTVGIKMKGELNDYYLRKVAEGKNKMSVINAIRAKLIFRMFAVIKNNKFYEKNYRNSLA